METRIMLAVLLWSTAAQAGGPIAEVICAPRDVMLQRLTTTQGAALAATGLRDTETVMEVWTSPKGDWTLVQSYTDGQSCILAMGADWDMPDLPGAG
jgi:Flp pilus assembly protein TadB